MDSGSLKLRAGGARGGGGVGLSLRLCPASQTACLDYGLRQTQLPATAPRPPAHEACALHDRAAFRSPSPSPQAPRPAPSSSGGGGRLRHPQLDQRPQLLKQGVGVVHKRVLERRAVGQEAVDALLQALRQVPAGARGVGARAARRGLDGGGGRAASQPCRPGPMQAHKRLAAASLRELPRLRASPLPPLPAPRPPPQLPGRRPPPAAAAPPPSRPRASGTW
jgi:hypothetical protein